MKVKIYRNGAAMIFPKKFADSPEILEGAFRYEPQEASLVFLLPDIMIQERFHTGKTEKPINNYPVKVRVYNKQTRFNFPMRIVNSTKVIDGRFRYEPQRPFLMFSLPGSERDLRIIQESYPGGNKNQKETIQDIFRALTLNQKAMIQDIFRALTLNQKAKELTRGRKQVVKRT